MDWSENSLVVPCTTSEYIFKFKMFLNLVVLNILIFVTIVMFVLTSHYTPPNPHYSQVIRKETPLIVVYVANILYLFEVCKLMLKFLHLDSLIKIT